MKINNFQGDLTEISVRHETTAHDDSKHTHLYLSGIKSYSQLRSRGRVNDDEVLMMSLHLWNVGGYSKVSSRRMASTWDVAHVWVNRIVWLSAHCRCVSYSESVRCQAGYVTLKIIHFHYLKEIFSGSKYPSKYVFVIPVLVLAWVLQDRSLPASWRQQSLCGVPHGPFFTCRCVRCVTPRQYGGAEWQWCGCYLLSE